MEKSIYRSQFAKIALQIVRRLKNQIKLFMMDLLQNSNRNFKIDDTYIDFIENWIIYS